MREVQELIEIAEIEIDSVIDTMSNSVSDEATIGHIELVLPTIKKILPYEKDGVLIKGKKPSEYMDFFQNKIAEYKDEEGIFENLRCAYGCDNTDLTVDYNFEDIKDIFERCKSCKNIYDKFALAIFYKNMGPQYRKVSLNMFKEVAEINPSNPILTPIQTLFFIAEYQNTCHEYIDAMRTYQKIFKITPDNPYVFVGLVDVFVKSDNKDLAYDTINLAKRSIYYQKIILNILLIQLKYNPLGAPTPNGFEIRTCYKHISTMIL